MPIWVSSSIVVFMPALFAVAATVLVRRAVRGKWFLFLLLAIFVFAGAQDIGMAPMQTLNAELAHSVLDLVARDTKQHFLADIVSALLGGLIMWRTAKVFGSTTSANRPSASDDSAAGPTS